MCAALISRLIILPTMLRRWRPKVPGPWPSGGIVRAIDRCAQNPAPRHDGETSSGAFRLMISTRQPPLPSKASHSFGPAWPPSAQTWRNHGQLVRIECSAIEAPLVPHVCWMHDGADHQAERAARDMTLAAVHRFF